ncbi:UNVERIFIED_CONTAM: hypothetical protein HDU68_000523 [Siphonaria sp. JEL0065]|nr:hypothetical protein HDU68_000523 [Siphonaria sp. JEL0065]
MNHANKRFTDLPPEIQRSLATPINAVPLPDPTNSNLESSRIYIGNLSAALDLPTLQANNIMYVIQVLEQDWSPFKNDGLVYLPIIVEDSPTVDLMPFFQPAVRFVEKALSASTHPGNVLIHCQMGASRSGTILIAVLMARLRIGRDKALVMAREARPCVEPNEAFWRQLGEWEMQLGLLFS